MSQNLVPGRQQKAIWRRVERWVMMLLLLLMMMIIIIIIMIIIIIINQGTTENSHIGHCTHTAESTDVKVQ
jgi:lipopolysaccharide/colanic/teichoic acid biosynthesis glycosyltransferase